MYNSYYIFFYNNNMGFLTFIEILKGLQYQFSVNGGLTLDCFDSPIMDEYFSVITSIRQIFRGDLPVYCYLLCGI